MLEKFIYCRFTIYDSEIATGRPEIYVFFKIRNKLFTFLRFFFSSDVLDLSLAFLLSLNIVSVFYFL